MKQMLSLAALGLVCVLSFNAHAEAAKQGDNPPPAGDKVTKADIQHALAGCAHCTFGATKQCMPAIKFKDTVFVIKPDAKASEPTRKLVASLQEMKETPKQVTFKGRPLDEKEAAALGGETKSYYEIGEMSIE